MKTRHRLSVKEMRDRGYDDMQVLDVILDRQKQNESIRKMTYKNSKKYTGR